MRGLSFTGLGEIALLAAHCDDLAIGSGGTILQLCQANPGIRVRALVLTGSSTTRADEERAALSRLCPGAELSVEIADFPDGRLPAAWADAKACVSRFAQAGDPDLVLGPQLDDAHQDHRALAEWGWQEFRRHTLWGYEIVKYEGDLPAPNLHVALDDATLQTKLDVLNECYPSQRDHDWFDDDLFRGIARVRGVHAGTRWAEAFVAPKLAVSLTNKEYAR